MKSHHPGRPQRSILRGTLFSLTLALTGLGVVPQASAERVVRSLPFTENFDSNDYSDLLWTTQGARHEHAPATGWRGSGAAKFFPPNAEGYSGLGRFMLSGLSQRPEQINVRWLIYHGDTWREYGPGGKLIIINRDGNRGRPMIILRESSNSQGTYETMGACDGTVCQYEGGDYWPDGTDSLRIGQAPAGREREWISVELEANTRTGIIRLYVDTQDGELSGLYIEQPMIDTGPGGIWSYVDIIGGYMEGASRQHAENYFMIDELVIDDSYIGPPEGFVSGARPSPPSNVRVQ